MTPNAKRRLVRRSSDIQYRQAFFESHINTSVAAQIKANREYRGWSQKRLAKEAGLFQSQISKMEDVNHERWTAKTLRRIARALDVVLVIRFERFSKALNLRESFPGNLVQVPFSEDVFPLPSPTKRTDSSIERIAVGGIAETEGATLALAHHFANFQPGPFRGGEIIPSGAVAIGSERPSSPQEAGWWSTFGQQQRPSLARGGGAVA